ncbi:hypothetical protein D9M71_609650 [compost metagenome]
MTEIQHRHHRLGALVLQIGANRRQAEVRRGHIAKRRHVFVARRHLEGSERAGRRARHRLGWRGDRLLRGRNYRSHRCRGNRLSLADRTDLDPRAGALEGQAILFRTLGIQIALDDDPPPGEQRGDTLRIGLEQPPQIGPHLRRIGTGNQLAGEGHFKKIAQPSHSCPFSCAVWRRFFSCNIPATTIRCRALCDCYTRASDGVMACFFRHH